MLELMVGHNGLGRFVRCSPAAQFATPLRQRARRADFGW
jgi:hypothetical protein